MKKTVIYTLVFAFVFVATASISFAAKPGSSTCQTIQGGTLLDVKNNPIAMGYDQYGYNYQAHMFNGWYDNNTRPETPVSSGDRLIMKWNDAWLSNKSCDSNQKLDRHYGLPGYIGSGAWLTNHASGTYQSSDYKWNIGGSWVIAVNGGAYMHDYTFTMTSLENGTFTGVGGYPAGVSPYTYDEVVINGQISGDNISFTASYNQGGNPTGYSWTASGTIDASGNMSGTGTSGVSEWHTTLGTAEKVSKTCEWSDFVKIIAVPADATKTDEIWYSADGTEIGPDIWGEFAIIQEVSSNPCGDDLGLLNYKSQLRAGLGNW